MSNSRQANLLASGSTALRWSMHSKRKCRDSGGLAPDRRREIVDPRDRRLQVRVICSMSIFRRTGA